MTRQTAKTKAGFNKSGIGGVFGFQISRTRLLLSAFTSATCLRAANCCRYLPLTFWPEPKMSLEIP